MKIAKQKYTMKKGDEEIIVRITEVDKDLGVHVDCGFNLNTHCKKMVAKVNSTLGLIKQSFTYVDEPTLSELYTSLVRQHLEYEQSA